MAVDILGVMLVFNVPYFEVDSNSDRYFAFTNVPRFEEHSSWNVPFNVVH